jgi:hypothetical protein
MIRNWAHLLIKMIYFIPYITFANQDKTPHLYLILLLLPESFKDRSGPLDLFPCSHNHLLTKTSFKIITTLTHQF